MPEEERGGGGWNGEGGREEREEEEGKNYTRHWLMGHLEMHHFLFPNCHHLWYLALGGKRDVDVSGQTVSHCVEGIFLKGMNDESAGAGGGFSPSIPLLGVSRSLFSPGSFGALSRTRYRTGQLRTASFELSNRVTLYIELPSLKLCSLTV